jgi:hypothetical protein
MGEIEVEHTIIKSKSLIFISKLEKTITKNMYTNMLIYIIITLMNVFQSCFLTPPKSPFFANIVCMFDKNPVRNLIL